MENPRVRRRVDAARANYRDARAVFESRFEGIESELWAWVQRLQVEATKAQRQAMRARDANQHYHTLGVAPGVPLEEVKAAWRARMRENHPDRFASDPAAEAATHARAQEINLAYEELTALLTGRETRRSDWP